MTARDASDLGLRHTAGLLAIGSSALLSVAIIGFPYVFPPRFVGESYAAFFAMSALVLAALMCHFLAWVRLYLGIRLASPGPGAKSNHSRVRQVFLLGSFASVVSFLLLPFQLGGQWGLTRSVLSYAIVFLSVLVVYTPFLPFVFGPIALSHAYIFYVSARTYGLAFRRLGLCSAAIFLTIVAVSGMVGQLLFYSVGTPSASLAYIFVMPVPAGLTAIPYSLAYLAVTIPGRQFRRIEPAPGAWDGQQPVTIDNRSP